MPLNNAPDSHWVGPLKVDGPTSTKGSTIQVRSVSAATNITDADDVLICHVPNAEAYTITLPSAVGRAGRVYNLKRKYTSQDPLTVAAQAGEFIDGEIEQAGFAQMTLISDGAEWHILNAA